MTQTTDTQNTESRDPAIADSVKLRDPDQVEREDRSVTYEWNLAKEQHSGMQTAVLRVSYHRRYRRGTFTALLSNETVNTTNGITERSFQMCAGASIGSEAVDRFTKKQMERFAATMLERVRGLYEQSDAQVHGYFQVRA